MIKCPKCGSGVDDDSRFCQFCQELIPLKNDWQSGHEKVAPAAQTSKGSDYRFTSAGQDTFVSIGDKNVIPGDVIGKQINVEKGGSATFINHENEADKLAGQCHACNQNTRADRSFLCPRCNQLTCEDCYDRGTNLCKTCREAEYKKAFHKARKNEDEDGWNFLSSESSVELERLREFYKIEPSRAAVLQKEVIGTECEPVALDNHDLWIFDDGLMEEACRGLCKSLNRYPYTTAFHSRLLYVILNAPSADPGNQLEARAADIIDMAFQEGNDSLDIYLVLIDQVLNGRGFPVGIRDKLKDIFTEAPAPDDLAFAKFLLNRAQTIWPENIHLKCRYIFYLQRLYEAHDFSRDRQLARQELSALNDHLPEEPSPMLSSWLAKIRAFDDSDFDPTPEYCSEHGLYFFILNPRNSETYYQKAKSVDTSKNPDRTKYFKLLTIAATQYPDPSPEALTELADCYISGFGTDQNVQQGLEYYRKAADVLGIRIEFSGTVFTSYRDSGRHTGYAVPPGITEIASGAFSDAALTTVAIPSTVETICADAFSGCGALETVVLSEGLQTIEKGAFLRCEHLRTITIPKTVTRLEVEFSPECLVMFAGDAPVNGSKVIFDDIVFSLPDMAGVKAIAYRFRDRIRSVNDSASWCHEALTEQCDHNCESCLLCSDHGLAELKILAFDAFCKDSGVSLPVGPSPLSLADIIFLVAEQYRSGKDGMPRDDVKAAKWYHVAAECGNAEAQFKIGGLYSEGIGIGKNDVEAMKWYRKAAEQGHAEAQFNLAQRYFNGVGVGSNVMEAVKWYRKAAEQGHVEAQFKLAGHYFYGTGVKKDEAEAFQWYRKAAEQGKAEAQFDLALFYYAAKGTEKDDTEAARWARKAARQNIADALSLYILGESCFFGLEGRKDYAEAVKWYGLAVSAQDNAGHDLSQSYRERIASHLRTILFASASDKDLVDASLIILKELSCWESFTENDWTRLLSLRPDCAKYCGLTADSAVTCWTKLSNDDWKALANKAPLFKTIYDLRTGNNVVQHLAKRPEMAKFCTWSEIPGAEWVNLLKEKDLIASLRNLGFDPLQRCPWDNFTWDNWVSLLSTMPEPEYVRRNEWHRFLKNNDPQPLLTVSDKLWAAFDNNHKPPLLVIEKMNWGKRCNWNVTAKQWLDYMINYPGLADVCNWDSFSADDWVQLLSKQPQFASKCRCWNRFSPRHWNDLILKRPEMQKRFSYNYLHFYVWRHTWNYTEYTGAIRERLSKSFAFLASSIFLLVFTIVSLFGETGWLSLFAESWKHALFSGLIWIVLSVICALVYSYIWSPFFSRGLNGTTRDRWLNLLYAGLASWSLYTFYHWSFFFSRWSSGMTILAVLSLLCFTFVMLDSRISGHGEQCHIWSMTVTPYFVTFCWFVLSPVTCSDGLTSEIVLLFILLSLAVWYEIRHKINQMVLVKPGLWIIPLIPPLIIGTWFLRSPISPNACYNMADSLRHSFKHASQALYQKGQSADPDYRRLSGNLNPASKTDAGR